MKYIFWKKEIFIFESKVVFVGVCDMGGDCNCFIKFKFINM